MAVREVRGVAVREVRGVAMGGKGCGNGREVRGVAMGGKGCGSEGGRGDGHSAGQVHT